MILVNRLSGITRSAIEPTLPKNLMDDPRPSFFSCRALPRALSHNHHGRASLASRVRASRPVQSSGPLTTTHRRAPVVGAIYYVSSPTGQIVLARPFSDNSGAGNICSPLRPSQSNPSFCGILPRQYRSSSPRYNLARSTTIIPLPPPNGISTLLTLPPRHPLRHRATSIQRNVRRKSNSVRSALAPVRATVRMSTDTRENFTVAVVQSHLNVQRPPCSIFQIPVHSHAPNPTFRDANHLKTAHSAFW